MLARKNIGPAGLTIVIIRDDLLDQAKPEIPSILKYGDQAKNGSMVNTPSTYAWYLSGLVFEWLLEQGGVEAIHKVNLEKLSCYMVISTQAISTITRSQFQTVQL